MNEQIHYNSLHEQRRKVTIILTDQWKLQRLNSQRGYPLESTLLKVGHHGSDSSTSYPFLYYVNPKYAVISVGQNNSYGHPSEDTLSKLRDAAHVL